MSAAALGNDFSQVWPYTCILSHESKIATKEHFIPGALLSVSLSLQFIASTLCNFGVPSAEWLLLAG
jgi:hypothetical protein